MQIIIALSPNQIVQLARESDFQNWGQQTLLETRDQTDTASLVINTMKGLMVYNGPRRLITEFIPIFRKASHDFNKFNVLKLDTDEKWLPFWETQEAFINNRAYLGVVQRQLRNPETLKLDLKKIAERFEVTKAVEMLKAKDFAKLNAGFSQENISLAKMLVSYESRSAAGGVQQQAASTQPEIQISDQEVVEIQQLIADVAEKEKISGRLANHNKGYEAFWNAHVRQYGKGPAGFPTPEQISTKKLIAPPFHGMTMYSEEFEDLVNKAHQVYYHAKSTATAVA